VARAEAYQHAKFHLDPSNRLATIANGTDRQYEYRQRSDSIGQIVLQTVAQKNRDAQKKRSSNRVRAVNPDAERESMVGKICERGRS